MATVSPEWLDYGALGVLLAVLIAIGLYIRDVHRFLERLIQTNTERMNEIVSASEEREAAHIEAWKEMMQMALKAQGDSEQALRDLCDALKRHDERLSDHHQDVRTNLRHNPGASGG